MAVPPLLPPAMVPGGGGAINSASRQSCGGLNRQRYICCATPRIFRRKVKGGAEVAATSK